MDQPKHFYICYINYLLYCYSLQEAYQASILKEQAHSKALEELLFMTSHQVRKPVANILGLIENIDADFAILSPADIYERCKYLQVSAIELDSVVKNLSAFIEYTGKQALDNG